MSSLKTFDSLPSGPVHDFPEEDLRSDGKYNRGYFPAWLGLLFEGGRYCVVRKLGWGNYSSVWLVRDFKLRRFAALKIMTAEATRALHTGQSDEVALLQKIANADRSHEGSHRVVEYYGTFTIDGPHGQHCCVLTEALSISLEYLMKDALASNFIKCVIRQVLLGLDYMHNACGIIHGDLKPANILFRPDNVEAVVTEDIVEHPSKIYALVDLRARPPVIPVVSQVLSLSPSLATKLSEFDVVITDFGHSHWRDRHLHDIIQPYALRAPEVFLGYEWDTSADIWSVGCFTAELLLGRWLFDPKPESEWDIVEDHLVLMTETTEEHFSLDMLDKCKFRNQYFRPNGTFAHFTTHEEPNLSLRNLLMKFSELSGNEQELDGASDFLRQCLRLRPEERAHAKDLANHPWLVQADFTFPSNATGSV